MRAHDRTVGRQRRRPEAASWGLEGFRPGVILALAVGVLIAGSPAGGEIDFYGRFFDPLAEPRLSIEVTATDELGRPVTDLSRDEFQLLEGGRPVAIVAFQAVRGPAPAEPGAPGAPATAFDGLELFVYIDRSRLGESSEARIQDLVGTALPALLASDEALTVVLFDGRDHHVGLDLIRLEELLHHPGPTVQSPSDVPTTQHLEHLEHFFDALSGIAGRKKLLYLGPELVVEDEPPGEGGTLSSLGTGFWTEPTAPAGIDPRVAGIHGSAQANFVALYTLDPGDWQDSDCRRDVERDAQTPNEHSSSSPLARVAAATGGAALRPQACRRHPLEPLTTDLAGFYRLVYPAGEVGTGARRIIEVRTAHRGLTLRYRRAFDDRPANERTANLLRAALLLDRTANPLGVDIELVRSPAAAERTNGLELRLQIPFQSLVLTPEQRAHRGRLLVSAAVRGADGRLHTVESFESPVRIPNDELPEAMHQVGLVSLHIPDSLRGERLAVSVHDLNAGVTSVLSVELEEAP